LLVGTIEIYDSDNEAQHLHGQSSFCINITLNTNLSQTYAFGLYRYMTDAMSWPIEILRLLSDGGASVIGIVRTVCHMITDVTANHRLR